VEEEEEVFQGDRGRVVVNVGKEVCYAATTIVMVVSG